jgi:hypothetical protein
MLDMGGFICFACGHVQEANEFGVIIGIRLDLVGGALDNAANERAGPSQTREAP